MNQRTGYENRAMAERTASGNLSKDIFIIPILQKLRVKANTVNHMALIVSLAEQLCGGSRPPECQQLRGCVLWALKWQIGEKGAGYTRL